jgi:hypothetical protein
MNRGVPPTALNARTGEFTPPGVTRVARSNQSRDLVVSRAWEELTVSDTQAFSPTTHERGEPVVGHLMARDLKS